MNQLLQLLFSAPSCTAPATLDAWWPWLRTQWADAPSLTARAALGGALAERLGFAFAAGYQCALRALLPSLPDDLMAALCATEAGGAHPKAIQTTLSTHNDGYQLHGEKTFVTLGDHASILLIIAKEGEQLRLASIPAQHQGVSLSPLPELPFVPEISHASVTLDHALIPQRDALPGDGYERYLKPFRTIEDIYVHLSMTGHLLGVARKYQWPNAAIEDILSTLSSLMPLASMLPLAPETHLTLSGVLRATRRLVESIEPHWALCPTEMQERWQRDKQLLHVAQKVRHMRTESAWKKMTLLTKR